MTATLAPERLPVGWLPLDDLPQTSLCPLELGVARLSLQGRARTLAAALGLPDPDGLSRRLIAQRGGQLFVHAHHLAALVAPLPAARACAFQVALGVSRPDELPQVPAGRPRLELLQSPPGGTRPLPGTAPPADPASRMTRAMQTLADAPGALSTYNAALASEALRGLSWHWLDIRSALHLELLGGLGESGGLGETLASSALAQVQTTLGGARRSAARALIVEARAQHLALHSHLGEQRAARRELLRAAIQGGSELRRGGFLNRSGDVRWLTPTELRDALDGTLDPATLRGLTQLRRLQHVAGFSVPVWTAVGQQFPALALSPGVRDGLLWLWQPGQPVPEGRIAVCAELRSWHWPQLQGAAALILDRAGELSAASLHARAAGLPALSLRGRRPEWLQDGAFVRLNAHQGTLTLLRRAEVPQGVPSPTLPGWLQSDPLDAGATTAAAVTQEVRSAEAPPPRPGLPNEITTINLDFDPL